MASVANTRRRKSANARAIFRRHELPEPLLARHAAVQAQQRGPRQVDLENPTVVVPEEMPDGGEIEQLGILLRCLLGLHPGPLEFLVLHLQFDLMHLQLVDHARASASDGPGPNALPPQALFGLAAQVGRLSRFRFPGAFVVHRFTLSYFGVAGVA